MKRPLVLLLALIALIALVMAVNLWPGEEAPPITDPEPTGPAVEQEPLRGSGGQIEWVESAGGELRFADLSSVPITMMWSMEEAQLVNQAYFAGMEQRLGPVAPGRYTVEIFRLGGEIVTEELKVPAGSPEFRRTLVYRP